MNHNDCQHEHGDCRTKSVERDAAEDAMEGMVNGWFRAMRAIVVPFINEITVGQLGVVENVIPWGAVVDSGVENIGRAVRQSLKMGADAGTVKLNLRTAFNVASPQAERWATEYVGNRIQLIANETKDAVRGFVERGIHEGRHPYAVARDLKKHGIGLNVRQGEALEKYRLKLEKEGGRSAGRIDDMVKSEYNRKERYRTKTIARTESAAAYAEGELEAYNESEVVDVEFFYNHDTPECPICLPLHKKVTPISKSHGIIPVHPNCRCDWLPVVE